MMSNKINSAMKYSVLIFLGMMVLACSKKSTAPSVSQDVKALFSEKNVVINGQVNLKGQQVKIKNKNLTIQKGGRLINGTLKCNNCTVTAPPEQIFDRITLTGDWTGNRGNLEWWLGSNFSNAMRNLDVLNALIQAGFRVELRQMIPIQAKDDKSVLDPHRLIDIVGVNREKSGLILMTKHYKGLYGYFQSDRGFNLRLENLSLISDDFNRGITTDNQRDYSFAKCAYQSTYQPQAKPSIDSIIVKNCIVKGAISIVNYAAHSNNQSIQEFSKDNLVREMEVSGCYFDNCNSPFRFSNMGYGDILIDNNKMYNFSHTLLFIPESGLNDSYYEGVRRNKKHITISNNHFKNDKVVQVAKDNGLSPCIVKGGYSTMIFSNNKIENLLSNSKEAFAYSFYFTTNDKMKVKNNTFKNVLGWGTNEHFGYLIKQKGVDHFIMENNTMIVEKEALVKIGVLKNVNEDLSKLDGNRFNYQFMFVGGNEGLFKRFIIRNNTFSVPFINRSSDIFLLSELVFENNIVNIDYFGPSKVDNVFSSENVFFYGRKIRDRLPNQPQRDFILRGNKIKINKTGDGVFNYVYFPSGQQEKVEDQPDKNINYKNVILEDVFEVNNTAVGMMLPDGENHVYNPTIKGSSNSFFLNDVANAFTLRPNAKTLNSNIKIESASWNYDRSPFVVIPDSRQVVEVKKHNGKNIRLLSYSFVHSMNNLKKEENLMIRFSLKGKNKAGKDVLVDYNLALDHESRTFMTEDLNSNFIQFQTSNKGQKIIEAKSKVISKSANEDIPILTLYPGDKTVKNAEVLLTKTENLSSYTIECQIYNIGRSKPTQVQFRKEVDRGVRF